MKFPVQASSGTLRLDSGTPSAMPQRFSAAEMTIVAPADGFISIRRDAGTEWSLLYFPGTALNATLGRIGDWVAPAPTAMMFSSSAFRGREPVVDLTEAVIRHYGPHLRVFERGGDGSFAEREPLDDGDSTAAMRRLAEELVADVWWPRPSTGQTAIVVPVREGAPITTAPASVTLDIVHAADAEAIEGTSSEHLLYYFDTREYLSRCAQARLFDEDTTVPDFGTGPSSRSWFRIVGGDGTPAYRLRGGAQHVQLELPDRDATVPNLLLSLTPTAGDGTGPDDSEVVLRGESLGTDGGTWSLGSSTLDMTEGGADVVWADVKPAPSQVEPVSRALIHRAGGDTRTIRLEVVQNLAWQLEVSLQELSYIQRRVDAIMDAPVPGLSDTTIGQLEVLRHVVSRLRRFDPGGAAFPGETSNMHEQIEAVLDVAKLESAPQGVMSSSMRADFDRLVTRRSQVMRKVDRILSDSSEESGGEPVSYHWGIYGPVHEPTHVNGLLTQALWQLRLTPEGEAMLASAERHFSDEFIAARLAQGRSGIRLAITATIAFGVRRVATQMAAAEPSARYAVVESYLSNRFPGRVLSVTTERPGPEVAASRYTEVTTPGGTRKWWVVRSMDLRYCGQLLRLVELFIQFKSVFDSVRAVTDAHGPSLRELLSLGANVTSFSSNIAYFFEESTAVFGGRVVARSARIAGGTLASRVATGAGVAASVIEMISMGVEGYDEYQERDWEGVAFAAVGVYGAYMSGAGLLIASVNPLVGVPIIVVGIVLNVIGRVGVSEPTEGPVAKADFHQLVKTLRYGSFGNLAERTELSGRPGQRNPYYDDVAKQLSDIYSYIFPVTGGAWLARGEVFLAIAHKQRGAPEIAPIDPNAWIHVVLKDSHATEIDRLVFKLGDDHDDLVSAGANDVTVAESETHVAVRMHQTGTSTLRDTSMAEVAVSLGPSRLNVEGAAGLFEPLAFATIGTFTVDTPPLPPLFRGVF